MLFNSSLLDLRAAQCRGVIINVEDPNGSIQILGIFSSRSLQHCCIIISFPKAIYALTEYHTPVANPRAENIALFTNPGGIPQTLLTIILCKSPQGKTNKQRSTQNTGKR